MLGTLLLAANSTLAWATTMTIDSYPNPAVAGEKLRYHVIVTQGAGTPCRNVSITLNLPSGVTFDSSWPGGFHSGGQVQWSLSRLHNETVDRWAEVTVDPGATIGSNLNASGSVSGSGCSATAGSNTTVDPGGLPNLSLDKTSSRDHVSAGGQFTYTIDYANTGNAPATGVVISDVLPANTTFSSATGQGAHAAGTVTWNLGTVAAGATGSVTLTVDVNSPLANGTVLQNTATMTSAELPQVSSPTVDVTVDSAPVLTVSKTTSSTHVQPGDTLNYTLRYDNVGTDRATGIVIRDTLPADVTFLSASPAATESNGVVTINAGSLDPGSFWQAYVSVQVNSPLANQTVLENRVSIASNETAEVDGPQTDVTVVSAPQLTLSKTASRTTVPAGGQVVYTLHYANIGSDQATSVVLEDVLPAESQFISATGGGSYSGGQVTWNLGSLAAGASGSVSLTVEAFDPITNGTVLHNTASLSANEQQQPATAFVNVTATSAPQLIIDKRVSSQTASPGDELVYLIRYGNIGSDIATGVTLEDHLPGEVTFVYASGGGSESGGIVDWSLPDIQPGASGSVSLTVKVNSPLADGLVLHNSTTIDSVETSPVSAIVANSDVTISSSPDWKFFKAAVGSQVQAGQQVVFFVEAENTGTAEATGVVIEDALPTGLTLVSTEPQATVNGRVLSWSYPSWAPATRKFFKIAAQVDSPQANGTRIENVASLKSNETGARTTSAAITVSSAPTLEIEKTVSRKLANPGDTLVYTLTYRNTGNDQATGVVLEDHLPADVTFVSASGGGAENQGIVDWNLGTLAAGASGSVTVTVTVNSPLANGTVLHNAATLDSTETTPVSAAVAPSDVTISSLPSLGLTKSVSNRQARPGDTLVYTLNYNNNGSDTATGVVLEDLLPSSVTFVSATGGGIESGGIVRWNLADLPAGASSAQSITVTVNSPLPDGTTITNTAGISSNETGPVLAVVSASQVLVSSAPAYLLSKSVSKKTASPGDTLVYTLGYSNTGTDTGTGVTLTDTLPAGVTFVSASGGGTHNNGVVTWPATDLPAGASGSVSVTVQVDSPLPNGTVLTNSANLTDGTRGSIGITDTTISSAPVLDISKTASRATVKPGDQLVYSINVSNSGTDAATGITIEDHLPPEVTFVSASGGGMHANGVVTWTAGSLDAGFFSPLSVTVLVKSPLADGTVLHNSATIDSNETAPLSSGVVDVVVDSAPAYLLSKIVSKKTASPGDTLVYTLNFSNTGTDIGTGVTLTDTLPPGVTFVSASGGGTHNNGVVSWPATDLPAGASGSVTVTVQVDSPLPNGTVLTNSANLTDGMRGSVGITDTTVKSAPVLSISKSASRTVAMPGNQLVYTIDISNTGTDAATGVTIEDHLPPEVTFVSASGGGTHNNGVVTWPIGDKPAGSIGSFSVTVLVNSPLANGTVLHNSATIDSNQTAPLSSGVVDVVVDSAPAYLLSKTVSKKTANPGDTLVYNLAYANTGTDTGTGVTLTDTLPPGVTFVSASGGGTHNAGVVSWPSTSLPAGASGSVSVTVQVNSPLPNGTVLTNSANLSDGTRGAIGITDTTVSSAPVLNISKTASRAQVNAGEALSYTLDFNNSGTDNATGVVIEDHLPPEVTFVSASDGGTFANGVVTWPVGDKPAGSSGSVSVSVQVNAPLPNGTVLHNSASVFSNETAPVSTGTVDVTVSSAPSLGIVKSANRTTVDAGGEVSYTLDFANIGTDAASSVVIEDHIPTDSTFVSASAGGVFSNGVVSWNVGGLPAGTAGSVSLTVAANSPLANGTVLHNTASIGSNETLGITSNLVDVVVSSAPVLGVSKTASQAVVNAGGALTYTIEYRNTGTDAATGVVLEDHLPPEVTFVSATGGATHSSGIVTWQLGTLPSGDTGSVTLTVNVNSPLADGTVLHNHVTVSSAATVPVSAPTTDVVVSSAPILTFTKSSSAATVDAGAQLSYLFEYANTGTDAATAVVIRDTVPPDTTFVSASAGGVFDAVSNTVTWNIGTVAASTSGSISLTVAVNSPLADGTVLNNQASIDSTETPPVASAASVTVTSSPQLVLSKVPNPSTFVEAGQQVNYELTLGNTGTDQAVNIVVTDQLPAGAVPGAIGGAGSYDAASNTISWSVASLQAGQSLTVSYSVTVPLDLPNGSFFNNTVSAVAANAPQVSTQSGVRVDSRAQLQLVKSGSNSVEAGTTARYVIEYFNAGNLTANNVVIKDRYPAGTSFVSASLGGVHNGVEVSWNLGDIPPLTGGSVNVELLADLGLLDGTVLVNPASIEANNATLVSSSASTVVRSHVELQQTIAGSPDPVRAGEPVTFEVITGNIGNEVASGVEIRASLPANTQFVSASAGGTYDAVSNEVVWLQGTIPALGQVETSFVAEVDSPLANGTLLTSVSGAVSAESQPVSAQATVTVSSAPLLLLGKIAVTGPDTPDNTVLYEISIQNQGNQDATGVVITDDLPYGLLAEMASDGGLISPDAKSVTWDLGTVPAGAAPVELQLLARAWTDVSGAITNTATASSNESPDVSASATIELQIEPYEEIPTLDRQGLALLVLLVMGVGFVVLRRID